MERPSSLGGSVLAVVLASLCGGCIIDPAMEVIEPRLHLADGASVLPVAFFLSAGLACAVAAAVWLGCRAWIGQTVATGYWVMASLIAVISAVPAFPAACFALDVFRDHCDATGMFMTIPGAVFFAIVLTVVEITLRCHRWACEASAKPKVKPNIATYPFDD